MWLQPQPEDVTDITTLVRMPFVAPLWEDAIPLAIPMAVDPAVTTVLEVPTSKGGPVKQTAGAGGELGLVSSTASTTAVMTMATTTTVVMGLTAMAAAVRQPLPGLRSRLAGLALSIAGVVGAGGHKSGSGAHLAVQPGGSGLGALGSAATLPALRSKMSKERGVLPPQPSSAVSSAGASSSDEWTEQELLAINDVWMAKVFPIIHKEYQAGLADPANLGKAAWQQDARHPSGMPGVEVVEPVAQPLHSSPKDAKLVRKLDLDDLVLSHREDLLTRAVSMNMRHPPTLPEFHGNQLTKNLVAFEGWHNRVLQAGQAGYTEDQVMAAISCSCREDALVVLTQLQTGTVPIMVKQVLSEFSSFSRSAEDDSLVKQLFNIEQGESELVNSYYLHLCTLLNDVVVNCPDYPLDRDFMQRQHLFHGLRVKIQGSLRYLYKDSKVTVVELLQKARVVEAEFAGGDQQLCSQTTKAQEAADQPGKATSVVVHKLKSRPTSVNLGVLIF